jgi:hypothetical protein
MYIRNEIIIKFYKLMNIPIYKIVVLGEGNLFLILGRVGKTSMSLKYVKNEFTDDQ